MVVTVTVTVAMLLPPPLPPPLLQLRCCCRCGSSHSSCAAVGPTASHECSARHEGPPGAKLPTEPAHAAQLGRPSTGLYWGARSHPHPQPWHCSYCLRPHHCYCQTHTCWRSRPLGWSQRMRRSGCMFTCCQARPVDSLEKRGRGAGLCAGRGGSCQGWKFRQGGGASHD